jgi:hypothetical protein
MLSRYRFKNIQKKIEFFNYKYHGATRVQGRHGPLDARGTHKITKTSVFLRQQEPDRDTAGRGPGPGDRRGRRVRDPGAGPANPGTVGPPGQPASQRLTGCRRAITRSPWHGALRLGPRPRRPGGVAQALWAETAAPGGPRAAAGFSCPAASANGLRGLGRRARGARFPAWDPELGPGSRGAWAPAAAARALRLRPGGRAGGATGSPCRGARGGSARPGPGGSAALACQ